MAQTSLNSTGVASSGALSLQSNGTTEAIGISTGQVATFAQNPILTSGTANGVAYLNGSKVVTSGSALVFDGSKLGIGTSPSYTLDIKGGTNVTGNWNAIAQFQNSGATQGLSIGYNTVTTNTLLAALQAGSGYEFWTYNGGWGSALNLTASGNLGLGVTPSAWNSAWKTMQVGVTAGLVGRSNGNLYLTNNFYEDSGGTDKYIANGYANFYGMNSAGQHVWYNAASGSAGGTVSFTQAMTLDASGNLQLGGTSLGDGRLNVGGITGSSASFHIGYGGSGDNYYTSGASGIHVFRSSTTERMRIDSSGNLLVGTTSQLNSGKVGVVFNGSGTNGLTMQTTYGSTGSVYLGFYNSANTLAGYVSQNGTTTVNYVTSSDARLKTNIVDADSAKAKIESIKIRKFDWVSGEHQDFGVIAQELFEVAPEAVSVAQTEEQLWGVDYSKLVPSLIKYVQEQQAIITQLQADVAALKA